MLTGVLLLFIIYCMSADPQLHLRKSTSEGISKEEDFFSKAEGKTYVLGGLMSKKVYDDLNNILLLVFLYMIQGIPIGLAFGSIPFLLQERVSYTDLGIFSLVGYPYSLKLLWAPIVDTIFSPWLGRRKSWIIPVQLCSGAMMLWLSTRMEDLLHPNTLNVYTLSLFFFILILFAATQDIAVDGWALTILSKENTSFSATCQTIGLNIGYFSSFTVFLALNSADFCNSYLRYIPQEYGMIELGGYLQFWAFVYLIFTVLLFFFKKEKPSQPQEEEKSLKKAYTQTYKLARRPHVIKFMIALGICKIGFIAAESVTALELISRGVKKEDLALLVLLDFPIQIVNAIFAGKVAKSGTFSGWLTAYVIRLGVAFSATFVVVLCPRDIIPSWYLVVVLLFSLILSSNSTFMFVSMGGFFATISDSSMGGTYLTLLNTVSNLGGTWPKFFILYLVDWFSVAHCESPDGTLYNGIDCLANGGALHCTEAGGSCINDVEGYYIVNILSVILGSIIFFYLRRLLTIVQNVDPKEWKIDTDEVDLSEYL